MSLRLMKQIISREFLYLCFSWIIYRKTFLKKIIGTKESLRSIAAINCAMKILAVENVNEFSSKLSELVYSQSTLSFECEKTQAMSDEILEDINKIESRVSEAGNSLLDRLTHSKRYWSIANGLSSSEFRYDFLNESERKDHVVSVKHGTVEAYRHIWRLLIPYLGMEPWEVYCFGPVGLRPRYASSDLGFSRSLWNLLFEETTNIYDVLFSNYSYIWLSILEQQDFQTNEEENLAKLNSAEILSKWFVKVFLEENSLSASELFEYGVCLFYLACKEREVRDRDNSSSRYLAKLLTGHPRFSGILDSVGIKEIVAKNFEMKTLGVS